MCVNKQVLRFSPRSPPQPLMSHVWHLQTSVATRIDVSQYYMRTTWASKAFSTFKAKTYTLRLQNQNFVKWLFCSRSMCLQFWAHLYMRHLNYVIALNPDNNVNIPLLFIRKLRGCTSLEGTPLVNNRAGIPSCACPGAKPQPCPGHPAVRLTASFPPTPTGLKRVLSLPLWCIWLQSVNPLFYIDFLNGC